MDLVERLRVAGCVAAEEEARELLAAAEDEATLELFVRRRVAGEPLAWITGTTEFCGHAIRVDPGVFVPRFQSEELARRAAELAPPTGWVADLCTGAGAIAVHVQAAGAHAVGVDRHLLAARCARANGVATVVGDLDQPLRSRSFDVVTAVAPYVPTSQLCYLPSDVQRYEPRDALDGGVDGLSVIRRVIVGASRLLVPGGWLVIELGGEQYEALQVALDSNGFRSHVTWSDSDGDLRGLATRLSTN